MLYTALTFFACTSIAEAVRGLRVLRVVFLLDDFLRVVFLRGFARLTTDAVPDEAGFLRLRAAELTFAFAINAARAAACASVTPRLLSCFLKAALYCFKNAVFFVALRNDLYCFDFFACTSIAEAVRGFLLEDLRVAFFLRGFIRLTVFAFLAIAESERLTALLLGFLRAEAAFYLPQLQSVVPKLHSYQNALTF